MKGFISFDIQCLESLGWPVVQTGVQLAHELSKAVVTELYLDPSSQESLHIFLR
jgi:hypothetical protein